MPDHHAAPYSLTEDFVTVYRLHPLLPDDYCFYNHKTGEKIAEKGFMDIQGGDADDAMRLFGLRNTLYSFGIAHPGAIALHNFPKSLIKLERDKEIIDLSVVDIVRTRRRGVPRYNDFRAGLHRPRVTRWEELATSPEDHAPAQGNLWRHRQGRHRGRAHGRTGAGRLRLQRHGVPHLHPDGVAAAAERRRSSA